jgi:CBS domain-containing membrane protein
MEKLVVEQVMSRPILSIKKDDNLAAAYDIMTAAAVRHVPVVNEKKELIGLISQTDLVRHAMSKLEELTADEMEHELSKIKAADIMVKKVKHAYLAQDIREAGKIMLDNKYGCLPVLRGMELVGILTEADFVKYIVEHANG